MKDAQPGTPPTTNNNPSTDALTRHQTMSRLQAFLKGNHTIVGDSGDNWFNTAALDLPKGAQAFLQLSYASIGWSLPAVLGASLAGRHDGRRAICLVGDGALQMTIQEISTIIRYRANPIIICINNFGYQIEEVLHAGPYNLISNWAYAKMVESFVSTTDVESGKGVLSRVVKTEAEFCQALVDAETDAHKDRLVFIEANISPNDVSDMLLKFGETGIAWNARPIGAGLNEGFHLNLPLGL
jgi:pyruvate decarboxylase